MFETFKPCVKITSCLYNLYLSCHNLVSKCFITDAHSIHDYQAPYAWNGGVGFISKEIIRSHCPAPASDIQVGFQNFNLFQSKIGKELLGLVESQYLFFLLTQLKLIILQILRCGPPAMNKAMKAHLDALGYQSEMQFEFWFTIVYTFRLLCFMCSLCIVGS